MSASILLLHGPNLSQLGVRDPEQYGTLTLDELVEVAASRAAELGATLDHEQHEDEGALVRRLHAARTDGTDAVVLNAGAYSHTSIALRDALELLGDEVVRLEVHLSNIHARESFRHTSVTAGACHGVIAGLRELGYRLAVEACVTMLEPTSPGRVS